MAVKRNTWQTVLIVGGILLAIGLLLSGLVVWYVAILVLLLALGGGALLSRQYGPPSR